MDSVVAHSGLIMFSAAVPRHAGEFHINEQPYDYWREKFAPRGFEMVDFLRPNFGNIQAIEPWYRYNTFLCVDEKAVDRIPSTVRRICLRRYEVICRSSLRDCEK